MVKINDNTIFRDAARLLEMCDQRLQPFLDGDDIGKTHHSLITEELIAARAVVNLCAIILSRVFGDLSNFGEETLEFIYTNATATADKVLTEAQQEAIEKDEENSTDE